MLLVLDANILAAALISRGHTLNLIFSKTLTFLAPEWVIDEIEKHRNTFIAKTGLTDQELDAVFAAIISQIKIIPLEEFKDKFKKAEELSPDPNDSHYFALALKQNCAIWSNDKRLKDQNEVKVITTKELSDILKN